MYPRVVKFPLGMLFRNMDAELKNKKPCPLSAIIKSIVDFKFVGLIIIIIIIFHKKM